MAADRQSWVITFEPLADDVAPEIRIRHLLKRALRAYRLKAVSVGPALPPASVGLDLDEGPAEQEDR